MSDNIETKVPVNASFGASGGLEPILVTMPNPYMTPAATEGLEKHQLTRHVRRYPTPADVCPL